MKPTRKKSVKRTRKRVDRPDANLQFQNLLLELSAAAAQGAPAEKLIQSFCRITKNFLNVSGVYYWQLDDERELTAKGAEGHRAKKFLKSQLRLDQAAVAVDAVQQRRTCYVNRLDAKQYPMAGEFGARALMAAPIILFGRVVGVVVFLHHAEENFFNEDHAVKVTILAAQLGSLLEYIRLTRSSNEHRRRAEDLMGLSLDLGSSLRLHDFVKNFTVRAVKLLEARSGVLALAQGSLLEVVAVHHPAGEPERSVLRGLGLRLSDKAALLDRVLHGVNAAEFLGADLAVQLGWGDLTVARLSSANGDLLGLLCLADRKAQRASDHLLDAVIGQASVALDNCRLFSRIAQANQHWMEIFDAMDDLIVVHDESNRVLRVNRSLSESIGARPAELIGLSMRALASFTNARSSQACPLCRRGTDLPEDYIHPVLGRTYLVSTSRIHGALDEGLQTIHVLKDITERREMERRYRELFDNIQEGLFFSTPEGRFVEVNDAMVQMMGYDSREDLLQADIRSQVYFSPELRDRFQSELQQHGVIRNYEEVLKRKDGTPVYTLQNTFAVKDAFGKTVQYRGLILDITGQKKYQTQLQRERDFNNKILDNTQSLILVVDTAGLISYANRRCFEASHYSAEEILGRRLSEFVPALQRDGVNKALENALHGEPVDNFELPLLRSGGNVGQFSANFSPMRDEQGTVSSIVVVMTDVTEAAEIQAKLRQTEKMAAIGQLVSGVAHEVNNPLTAILGFADLLASSPEIPESAKNELQVILQEAQRTKVIVQNLLSFARKMPPRREPVQLNEIIHRTLQLRAYDFASHNVETMQDLDLQLFEVMGDGHQLQQVVLNIVNNAYDAIREAGRAGKIHLTTRNSGDCVEIIIRDNGGGIEDTERIFDPFFTTKEVGKGTGLGLSICYGIVREHAGEVSCYNNRDGPGATFTVRLPALSAGETQKSSAAAGGVQA